MKEKRFSIVLIFLSVALVCTNCSKDEEFLTSSNDELSTFKSATFSLSPEVENAIDDGIAWMLPQQNPTLGYFSSQTEGVAKTALAVTKLCDRSVELGFYPPSTGPYSSEIENGLKYIFNNAHHNPDGGIFLSNSSSHSVYNTGIAMMAIAATRCPDCIVNASGSPVDGLSYQEVLQQTVDFFITAQNSDGGWRYYDHSQPSDNSNTGFAVLGLMAAEGAGIEIPQTVKDELSLFIDMIQDDASGGSKYMYNWDWINTMKTGNLLFEMAFVGDAADSPRVLHALEYIGNHWNDVGSPSIYATGWTGNYLAMYCLMKGFVAMGIETIDVVGTEVDWYHDFVEYTLDDLPPWPLSSAPWLDPYLSSVFGMLMLEKITPVPFLQVDVDVKPQSCPNPLNRGAGGVIPVAILGTENFDVTTIDPASVNIGGVHAQHWSCEDVATPYMDGFNIPPNEMDCTTEGPDGFVDLVLHFPTQDIAALFLDKNKGDVILIKVDGQLVDDGLSIFGEDVMIIKK